MTIQSQMAKIHEKLISKAYFGSLYRFNPRPSTKETRLKLLQQIIDIWQDDIVYN